MNDLQSPLTLEAPRPRLNLSEELTTSPRARVMRQVREWIESGTFPSGQPLPSERVLGDRFGVDPRTVRSALNMLRDEGLLRSNGGRLRLVNAPGMRPAESVAERGRNSLLKEAIAVMAPGASGPPVGPHTTGWSVYSIYGALDAIRQAGLHALSIHPDRFDVQTLERLALDEPRGVIIPDLGNPSKVVALARMLAGQGLRPVVYGDSPELAEFDRVTSDHELGSYLLTRWLIEQGRRRIVCVWPAPATQYWFPERRAGYERAMREGGLEPLPTVLVPQFESGTEVEARLWGGFLIEYFQGKRRVDAIVMAADGHIDVVAGALRLFGLVPNQDVAIVGYDNIWEELPAQDIPVRPLATVDKQNEKLGAALVRLVLESQAPASGPVTPGHGGRRLAIGPKLIVLG